MSVIDERCYAGLERVIEIEFRIIYNTEPFKQEEWSCVLATCKPQSLHLQEPLRGTQQEH